MATDPRPEMIAELRSIIDKLNKQLDIYPREDVVSVSRADAVILVGTLEAAILSFGVSA